MSRSYRRPYMAVTGVRSAHQDKTLAARGARRAQNRALRDCQDWDELIIPHRLECSFNNVWCWTRDGQQRLQFPPRPPGEHDYRWPWSRPELWYEERLQSYLKSMRK